MMTDCERTIERLLDSLTGESDIALDAETRRHLESCPTCQAAAEEHRRLWSELDEIGVPALDPSHTERFRQRLTAEVAAAVTDPHRKRARLWRPGAYRRVAALLAAALLGGAAGYLAPQPGGAGSAATDSGPPAAGVGRPAFLLLLHEQPGAMASGAEEGGAVVAEYAAWAGELAADGRLLGAEKLSDEGGLWLAPVEGRIAVRDRSVPQLEDVVTGYFVIRAQDYTEATSIAMTSPHLRYGGSIELRQIDSR